MGAEPGDGTWGERLGDGWCIDFELVEGCLGKYQHNLGVE